MVALQFCDKVLRYFYAYIYILGMAFIMMLISQCIVFILQIDLKLIAIAMNLNAIKKLR